MKDNLEDFVREHRAAFDDAMPPLKVWSKIDKKLEEKPPTRKISVISIIRNVAAVFALMAIGALMAMYLMGTQAQIEEKSIAVLNPDYEEIEAYYKSQISKKVALLSHFKYDPSIEEDLEQLDDFLQELKIALREAPKGKEEQIINAMINNYKTRMEILERVLNQIQTKNQKNIQKEDHKTI